jgi:4-amino-4-deoxy-L-arabinose transferase-like glycosyltransferase
VTAEPESGPLRRWHLAYLLLLCLFLFGQGISSRELWASHEARAAQNAQRMLDDSDWLLPRLYDDQVELQKPPGYYWLAATFGAARGEVDRVAVRLPAVLGGIIAVLLVWWYLQREGRPVAGLLAASMLATAVHWTGTARLARIDVPLAACIAAMMVFGVRNCQKPLSIGRIAILSLLGAIALYLKGPIGLVLPGGALLAHAVWTRTAIGKTIRLLTLATLGAVALFLPWYLFANRRTDGEFFRVFILYHHFNRAFGGADALAGYPWWYYVPRFLADFLPWTPIVLFAAAKRLWRNDPQLAFGLIWFAVMFVGLSVSRFKRADYLLPAYPGAAIACGCVLESRLNPKRLRLLLIGLSLFPLGWLAFDRWVTTPEGTTREQKPFADLIRREAPQPEQILLFRVESHLLAYHLGRPLHTLVEWGELNAILSQPGCHFWVTRAEFLDECRRMVAVPFEVVGTSDDVSSAKPQRPYLFLRTVTEP